MDAAVATLDFVKAGAILANMIESYLAGGAAPSNTEGADHDDLQDCRSPSVAASLHLHSSVDTGASPLQSGEHRAPIQSGEQSKGHGITWDQFLANRKRLAANRTNSEVLAGPSREGLCLLQGLLLCGTCGRRLSVRYTGNGGLYPIYQCNWKHREGLAGHDCMSVSSKPLDDAITER